MKEIPLSTVEKASLLEKIQNNIRLDDRHFLDIRPWKIDFGKDYGCALVTLGDTKVFSQVTCEVVTPRPSRPNEGRLSIQVHLSPMAAPHFEQGRGNEIADEIQHILDRNIKDSRCLDLESLCIMAEDSVWQFKVDVTVLNHAGNLTDACNIAAVAALRHFHRPDVTVEEDGRVNIHTAAEKELIPTYMKLVPVCLTFGFFLIDEEHYTILDPSETEERVLSGKLIIGMNPHGEVTSMEFPGNVELKKSQILGCISNAFAKAKEISESIMQKVDADIEARKSVDVHKGYLKLMDSEDTNYKMFVLENKLQGTSFFLGSE